MHNIEHYTYSENVNKSKVEAELNNHVSYETRREGGGGLNSPIRWINDICNSKEEAEVYIRNHDKGWYDQLAVMYREVPLGDPTKKIQDLKTKLNETRTKYNEMQRKVVFQDFKSDFVGCKNCGSKLSTKYLKSNGCPLCGNDMRSQTTLNSLARLKEKGIALEQQLNEEVNKVRMKNVKKGTIKWLVKIEYHT